MNDNSVKETIQTYEAIIQEVISKLKRNSEKGQLQMSESEIQQFKDHWLDNLKRIQQQKIEMIAQQPSYQQKKDEEEVQDEIIVKKVKTNEEERAEVKEEEEDNEDDVDNFDLNFKDSDQEEDVGDDQIKVKLEQQQTQNNNDEKNRKEFETKRIENQRERTLFDKIREIQRIQNELKTKQEDDDEQDDPKDFGANIYAQKINQEQILSRIRPNKLQKMFLESVLIKEQNKEIFVTQAVLQFNFKTNKKIKQC